MYATRIRSARIGRNSAEDGAPFYCDPCTPLDPNGFPLDTTLVWVGPFWGEGWTCEECGEKHAK